MNLKILSKQRSGSVVVYLAIALVVLMGAAGLSIDVGNLYLQRDKAQRAADAAALAGALELMDGGDKDAADAQAKIVATANGYDSTKDSTFTSVINPDGNHPSYYQVRLSKPAPVFFMAIFGWRYKTIGAPATATYQVPVDIDINGGGEYGKNGPVTLSMFGPYGQHTNGDCYSTIYLQNNQINDKYVSTGQYGYDFKLSIPKNYASVNGTSKVDLQIFDPDTYNGNGSADAVKDHSVDEIRYSQSGNPQKSTVDDTPNYDKANTTTRYRLYDTKGNDDPSDDELIAEATYRDDSSTDMKWVTPDGFEFDINDSRWADRFAQSGSSPVDFRINIKTINGASENGFNLRAGPPPIEYTTQTTDGYWTYKTVYNSRKHRYETVKDQYIPASTQYCYNGSCYDTAPSTEFNSDNGTNITATGRIPMNFNSSGTATIKLGNVAATATRVSITKFDTDVGSQSVTYNDGITTRNGVLSGGDEWETDIYDLGSNYPGGDWTATYRAGTGDTSVWDMSYEGPSLSTPGGVRLVK